MEKSTKEILGKYFGIGDEINCPNCGTEINYNAYHWNSPSDTVIIKGHCLNPACLVYKKSGMVSGFSSSDISKAFGKSYVTWRHATDAEIAYLENKFGWEYVHVLRQYDVCSRDGSDMLHFGIDKNGRKFEIEGEKMIKAVCGECGNEKFIPSKIAKKIREIRAGPPISHL